MKDACVEDDSRKFIVQIDENDKDREKKLMFINVHNIRDISYINFKQTFTFNNLGQQVIQKEYLDEPIVEIQFNSGGYIHISYEKFKKYLGKYVNFFE